MTLTPEQFNKLAMKDDLKDFATKEELKEMKNEILTTLDGIAKNFKDHQEEHTFNIAAHDRFEERIAKVENTIKIAEKA